MASSKKADLLKIISINLAVFAALSSLSVAFFFFIKRDKSPAKRDLGTYRLYSNYPVYVDSSKAFQAYQDQAQVKTKFAPFVDWTNTPYKGKELTIKSVSGYGIRLTSLQGSVEPTDLLANAVWFFGGSTMYGYGVSDDQTIPAYYQSISGNRSVNFGVSGYTSRQSLNLLLSLLALGYRPKAIIFYDGINELHSCVQERIFWSTHAEENNIAKKLSNGDSVFAHLRELSLKPIRTFRNMNNPSGQFSSPYMHSKCVDIPAASVVATQLLLNWSAAEAVAASKRIPFFAILQPTLNTVGSKPRYFIPDPYWKQMNLDVYAQIRARLSIYRNQHLHGSHSRNFIIDGTKWIDSSDVVFIDDGHLGPSGNRLIALRINQLISDQVK